MKESITFIFTVSSKENEQLKIKRLKLPAGFQGMDFKGSNRHGEFEGAQLSSDWWVVS